RHGAHLRRADERHQLWRLRAPRVARSLRGWTARLGRDRRHHRARCTRAASQSRGRRRGVEASALAVDAREAALPPRLRRALQPAHRPGASGLRFRFPRGYRARARAGDPLMPAALPTNRFKRALASGTQQIGFWLNFASPTVTEVCAGSGFDWLLIDMEHSPNELPDVVHNLRACVGGTAEPAVRVPGTEPVIVKR